jgi:hypothetical protein
MNNEQIRNHVLQNLNVPINDRLTIDQRNALERYNTKVSLLNTIHDELADKIGRD